jgi:hypothetical protein
MPRIAILGSCVTRDVWRVVGLESAPLRLVSRTSLASMMALRPRGFTPPATPTIGPLSRFATRCVLLDAAKTGLDYLEAFDPDYLIFDFMDERFDLLACPDTVLCMSHNLVRSGLAHLSCFRPARIVRRFEVAEAWHLWIEGLRELRRRITHGPLARATLVLHRTKMADRFTGVLLGIPPERLALFPSTPLARIRGLRYNRMFEKYHDAFLTAFPGAAVIDVPEGLRIADAAHSWGPDPLHFVDDYYHAFAARARTLGIDL